MSATLQNNRKKLEELRKRIRNTQTAPNTSQSVPNNIPARNQRQFSLQKSQDIHIPGTLIQTYQQQVQCILETKSLESKPHKEDQDLQQQTRAVDLLQPKGHRRRVHHDHDLQPRQTQQLNQEELQSLIKSRHFSDFFHQSSKLIEKVLDHDDGDMIQLYLRDGMKSKKKAGSDILGQAILFQDKNYTSNRVVTDIDWSSQFPQLFLASYSQNEEGGIRDHVGVILLWSLGLKARPQFYCFCQSPVTSAKFFPFTNNTVVGGCYNGQLLLWDIRVKAMPVQRSGISAQAHKYPVNSLNITGTSMSNNIVSFSNDGMMCLWDIKQFSKPIKVNKLSAARSARQNKKAINFTGIMIRSPELGSGTIIDKNKDEPHDINITCCEFPVGGDGSKYFIGSLNGVMYQNEIHSKPTDKPVMYDQHNGPISSVSINNPSSQSPGLSGLILTSSFDWTVKLWSPTSTDSIRTFDNANDYIYDVCWNPGNPSLFATANNDGNIHLFDLTKDVELPVAEKQISNSAQNKCRWNADGSALISGDSAGNVHVVTLAQNYRTLDHSKLDDFQKIIRQNRDQN